VSAHFALGQHAVEQLNQTNLNTNEVYINQYPGPQQQQQQAQATFPAAQIIFNPKSMNQVPMIDNKVPVYASNQPHRDHQQQIVFQSPNSAIYNQQIPSYRNQEKQHSAPLIYQHAQQMPLIYQYQQQQSLAQQPQINYYQQYKPQEIIYHQQPIASMASLQQPLQQQYQYEEQQQQQDIQQQQVQQHQQDFQQQQQQNFQQQQQQDLQQQFVVEQNHEHQFLPTALPAEVVNNGNINVELTQVTIPQEINSSREEISLPQVADGVNGNLIQIQPEVANNVATDNQKIAKQEKDDASQSQQEDQFQSPIIVEQQNEQKQILFKENETVYVQPNQGQIVFENYQPAQKQINIQILTDLNNAAASNQEDQFLKDISETSQIVNGHTNSNNYQYLVDGDQDFKDSTVKPVTEAPSRQFLKNFKNFRLHEQTTTSQAYVTSTTRTVTKSTSDGGCCKGNENSNCCNNNKSEEKVLDITQRPYNNRAEILAPVHAGVRLTNEKMEDCIDGHTVKPNVVEVQKTINIVVQQPRKLYGEKLIAVTTPIPQPVVTQPIYIEQTPRTKIISQPIIVEKQHHTEVVHPPVYIEKPIIKEVHVPVEKQVFIKSPPKIIDRPVYIKSPPQTKVVEKIIHHPVEVEKVVEKIVDRPVYFKSPPETKIVTEQVFVEKPIIKEVQVPVEKTVYVKSPPETKIVHQPVIQTVEKPVYIEKFIDRPVDRIVERPVYQTIEKIVDRPVIQTVEKIVEVEKPVIQTVETPVYIEKIVDRPVEKFIDRPYPVPYAVPYEKHIFHKPDFHVIAKTHKHKLFDFDGLFGFLSKKKEVKHIYVPASHQHQLNQLGHHQLIASTLTTIDPVKEAPVLDYSRYATTHLNPIKPVYGVPSAPLAPLHTGYNYPNPYASKTFI
jgi:hypothetical protein